MNQKIFDSKYLYNSIEKDKPIYILKTKNNSTQTINGYEPELKSSSEQMTYNSSNKWYSTNKPMKFISNVYTMYYIIIDLEIIKPENTDIAFYQLTNIKSRNDDTITFPANSDLLVDTINWMHITSTVIANGVNFAFILQCFDQSENFLDIPNLTVNFSIKSYPIY